MKILSLFLLAGAAWAGTELLSHHSTGLGVHKVLPGSDASGFLQVPPPVDMDPDTIYVVAAENCPHAAAQKADQLAKDLGAQGIRVQRTHQVAFRPDNVDGATMDRLSQVMNGPLPLVFIHGRVAPDPALAQVVEEYSRAEPSTTEH